MTPSRGAARIVTLRRMPDDAELLESWRNGDRRAGTTLFERHFESIRRFFINKVSDSVEDLVQQTFMACVTRRDSIREVSSFRGYLFAVARSKLYDHLSARVRAPEPLDPERTSVVDLGVSPSQMLVGREDRQLLLQALRHLPVDLQVALELYYFEQVRGRELELALGIPGGTVRSRLRRGLELLRREIDALAQTPELRRDSSATLAAWTLHLERDTDGDHTG
jgi:RNA polymerase sigma factor (sigma-70 family)